MFDAVALGTLGAAGLFIPSLSEVRKADPDDEDTKRDLIMGGAIAGLLSLLIVASYANRTKSANPYLIWLMVVGSVAGVYWYAYKREQSGGTWY